MTSTAMMAGTAAASSGIRGGGKLGPAFEAEGREFFLHFTALTAGTFDFVTGIENDLFEIVLATLTMILEDRHGYTPL
jgi:hypothetical protein